METETETKNKFDQKQYNKNFMEKVKDKKYKCEVCDKEYTYYAKSKHVKSQYHKLADKFKNKI